MTQPKHLRMKDEYNGQCHQLETHQKRFRKIGRKQIEQRALRKKQLNTANNNNNVDNLIRRGIKSLDMTPELCGLLRKINNTRRMLYMEETTAYKLLR